MTGAYPPPYQAPYPANQPVPGNVPLDQPAYGIGPIGAVGRFFRKYATFSGRASRSEYWWTFLFLQVVGFLLALPALPWLFEMLRWWIDLIDYAAQTGQTPGSYYLETLPMPSGFLIFMSIIGALWSLATLVPTLALSWRRLHDANLAGPWYFLSWVTSGISMIVMAILPPKPEGARFDANPSYPPQSPYPSGGFGPGQYGAPQHTATPQYGQPPTQPAGPPPLPPYQPPVPPTQLDAGTSPFQPPAPDSGAQPLPPYQPPTPPTPPDAGQ